MTTSLPQQTLGVSGVHVSRIALGCMGLAGTWDRNAVGPENIRKAVASFEAALEAGINFFDHADIYGDTACESVFKECLKAVPGSRDKIFIATKVGIRRGYYEHDPNYIRESIEGSLKRMGIEKVDLYQIHRPDPLSHPSATAEVLDELVERGLVGMIGVSNYHPHQTLALQRFMRVPIISNQIEISLLHLRSIYEGAEGNGGNGVLDQCMELGITPLAYSPVGRGWLSGKREVPEDHSQKLIIEGVLKVMHDLSPLYNNATPSQLAIAWLLKHPAGIVPLVGSNTPSHIQEAANAANINLSRTDWYKLWVAGRGSSVP